SSSRLSCSPSSFSFSSSSIAATARSRIYTLSLHDALPIWPKQQLPRYPKRIAVVTSPSGAVIRDIITTVKRRYPIAQLVLFPTLDRKSTRLNSSHVSISYAVFCLKKKTKKPHHRRK